MRYRLLNHVHGLPSDPPRWGERPRLRSKTSLQQGAGTTIAVLDSGASEHPWLQGSFTEDPLPDSARELWDLSEAALPRQVGHGTFVCGVVLQYAPAAKLMPRRVIDIEGDAHDDQLAGVIEELIACDPDIVNLSLGPTPADEPGEVDEGTAKTMTALAELQDRCGTIVVAAAGEIDEEATSEQLAPAGPLSLIVGALDLSGQPAWFSGIKPVTIWAPGVDVLSSFVHYEGPISLAKPGDHTEPAPSEFPVAPFAGWARWNGTSFAAPAVTGAIAAELSALVEDADPATDRRQLRLHAVRNVLHRARPLLDGPPAAGGSSTGLVLNAIPVAMVGPPAEASTSVHTH